MESSKVKVRVIFPPETSFDFAGDGLDGSKGVLKVDHGAGMTINELGRLILDILEDGGLGYIEDKLCINTCAVAARLAGHGLHVVHDGHHCKLAVDFGDAAGCGLRMDEDGNFALDAAAVAGTGLVANADGCEIEIDAGFLAGAMQSQINNDSVVDPDQTVTLPYVIDTEFRYKPNGYGYNSGLEIVKTTSTLIISKNAAGRTVRVEQGPVNQTTQDFDFGTGIPQNVAARPETPSAPNFYAKD